MWLNDGMYVFVVVGGGVVIVIGYCIVFGVCIVVNELVVYFVLFVFQLGLFVQIGMINMFFVFDVFGFVFDIFVSVVVLFEIGQIVGVVCGYIFLKVIGILGDDQFVGF